MASGVLDEVPGLAHPVRVRLCSRAVPSMAWWAPLALRRQFSCGEGVFDAGADCAMGGVVLLFPGRTVPTDFAVVAVGRGIGVDADLAVGGVPVVLRLLGGGVVAGGHHGDQAMTLSRGSLACRRRRVCRRASHLEPCVLSSETTAEHQRQRPWSWNDSFAGLIGEFDRLLAALSARAWALRHASDCGQLLRPGGKGGA